MTEPETVANKLDTLIQSISDAVLRDELVREVASLKKGTKFGLVFEEHLPERVLLPNFPIRKGTRVVRRGGKDAFLVSELRTDDTCLLTPETGGEQVEATKSELMAVKAFGEPVYPVLTPVARLGNGGSEKPWHTIINADNYHALQLLVYCYAGQVDVIYIDPPYNTGARDWKYNNDYVDAKDSWRHSKWLSMIKKRLILATKLLCPNGIICITIDDCEVHHLKCLIEDHLAPFELIGTVAIKTSPSGRPTLRGFRTNHEYAVFIGRKNIAEICGLKKSDSQLALFNQNDEDGSFAWGNLRKRGGANTLRHARPKQFYPIYVKGNSLRIPSMVWDKAEREWSIQMAPKNDEVAIYPIGDDGKERIWSWGHETAREHLSDLKVDRNSKGNVRILRKDYLESNDSQPSTWWDKNYYSIVEHGTVLLEQIVGKTGSFPFPKSVYAVSDSLRVCSNRKNALILDFFAGSGTTYHATALLNAEDGGNRRCILVTNNEVGEKPAKELNQNGYFPGDSEYDKHGICESATWPRCKYVTQGKRDDGTVLPGSYLNGRELAQGFAENVEYFRLGFADGVNVARGKNFNGILPILWLMAGAHGERETHDGKGNWFIPKNSPFAVLLREESFADFAEAIVKRSDIELVFLVTNSQEAFNSMMAELPGTVRTKMLYRSYLKNFEINTGKLA